MLRLSEHQLCPYGVGESIERLIAIIGANPAISIVARIDQAALVASAGLDARPCEMLLFENRALAATFYRQAPEHLFALPIRILVWEDAGGQSWLRATDPQRLAADIGLPVDDELIRFIEQILGDIVSRALGDETIDMTNNEAETK